MTQKKLKEILAAHSLYLRGCLGDARADLSEDARLEYEQSAVAQPQVSRTHLSAKTALKIH